jgi:hypothetical protein
VRILPAGGGGLACWPSFSSLPPLCVIDVKSARKTRLTSSLGALAVMSLVSAVMSAAGTAQAAAHADSTSAAPGTITTVAGGVGGPGKATTVSLDWVCGLAAAGGDVYLGGAGTVRRVNSAGYLTTPAGDRDSQDPLGPAGPAVKAQLGQVCGVTVDHSGNLVLSEFGPSVNRIVVPLPRPAPSTARP